VVVSETWDKIVGNGLFWPWIFGSLILMLADEIVLAVLFGILLGSIGLLYVQLLAGPRWKREYKNEQLGHKKEQLRHKKEWTKPCYNCKGAFYSYPGTDALRVGGEWIEFQLAPLSHCEECKDICKSCGTKNSVIDLNRVTSDLNNKKVNHHYCYSCSNRLEGELNKQKTILFRRPQPQSNERKITDKEKQDVWEKQYGILDSYYYYCEPPLDWDTEDPLPFCSWFQMAQPFEGKHKSEEVVKMIRNASFEMEIDFYRTVIPEPMVVLRCKECAIHQNLISEDAEPTTEKRRSRSISEQVKNSVWRRDEGKCVECGSNENLEFDHIIPHSKGGANTKRNIQLLCESCNRKKSDNIG
jgi:hypothetical protein